MHGAHGDKSVNIYFIVNANDKITNDRADI